MSQSILGIKMVFKHTKDNKVQASKDVPAYPMIKGMRSGYEYTVKMINIPDMTTIALIYQGSQFKDATSPGIIKRYFKASR